MGSLVQDIELEAHVYSEICENLTWAK